MENAKMRLPFWCSGRGEDGAHCYSGPPRWPDEVLGSLSRPAACGNGRSFSACNGVGQERARERRGGRERVRWVADLKLPHMVGRSSTMPGRGACPILEDGAGLARRGRRRRELEWMEAARMYRQRSLDGKWSYIEPDAESDGAAPCSAAESLRPGGDDAEVGPETAPQDGQAAHHATQTQVAAP